MGWLGGSFAPPLTDEKLAEYKSLVETAPALCRERSLLAELLTPALQWWELPESKTAVKTHGHGMLFQPLDESIAGQLWEALPWDEQLHDPEGSVCEYARYIDAFAPELCRRDGESAEDYARRRATFKDWERRAISYRDGATHLLWHAKELGLRGREPITVDRLTFAPSKSMPILPPGTVAGILALIAAGGITSLELAQGHWSLVLGHWSLLPLGMALRIASGARSAGANAIFDRLNSGTIKFYTGSQPGSVGGSESGNTLLATCTYGATAFGAASSGAKTANSITSDTNAAASGTAGHALNVTSGAATDSDATCGQGSGDFNFDNSSIVAGGTVAISSLTATQPQ